MDEENRLRPDETVSTSALLVGIWFFALFSSPGKESSRRPCKWGAEAVLSWILNLLVHIVIKAKMTSPHENSIVYHLIHSKSTTRCVLPAIILIQMQHYTASDATSIDLQSKLSRWNKTKWHKTKYM